MVYLDKERITGYKSDVLKAVERIEGMIDSTGLPHTIRPAIVTL